MNIWLVTIGEPIPHHNNKLRLHRTGIIAKYISENTNHNVTWWTSDFNHFAKNHIFGEDTNFNPFSNLNVIALSGKGYRSNISIDRIIDHKQIAKKFTNKALKSLKPDIIVVAFPTLGLCEACTDLGKEWGVPVLIDYRDMWPEVFVEIVPNFMKPIVKLVLSPLFIKTNKTFKKATGIIGITDGFLKLALDKIKRGKNEYDGVFPLAYLSNQFTPIQLEEATIFWEKVVPKSNKLRISFLGTLGHQFDFDTILGAVEILNVDGIDNFEIILCGSGDKEKSLVDFSKKHKGIYLPGYISAAQISSLLKTSDLGLCPYILNEAFLNSIPGKAIEYMSFGVPLLSTLKSGELGSLIDKYGIGFHYNHGSPESLAGVIKNLISIRHDLPLMKNRILSVYKSKFDADLIYRDYVRHLEKVVRR
jgi:glycosyltransferase involved in cell wall biosynthesis